MCDFSGVVSAFGESVVVWGPNRTDTADAGVNDPAWVNTGTAVQAVIEELRPEETMMAGGPITGKTARLYLGDEDGGAVQMQDLVVAENGVVWRIMGEVVRFGEPLPHYMCLMEYVPNPPVEVLS